MIFADVMRGGGVKGGTVCIDGEGRTNYINYRNHMLKMNSKSLILRGVPRIWQGGARIFFSNLETCMSRSHALC